MNEHELDLALGTIGRSRMQKADPPALHQRVLALPFDSIPQKRR